MDDHSRRRMLLKDLGGKKVEADFDSGEATSNAGVLFLILSRLRDFPECKSNE